MTLQLGRDVKCVIMTLQTKKHPRRKDNDVDALSAKRVRYDLEATLPHLGIYGIKKAYSLMQLRVAYRIANKKPPTIAEKLIKPCAGK